MSRTLKAEHASDGWHVGCRLARQARPAGRVAVLVRDELVGDDGEGEDLVIHFEPAVVEPEDCGCWCRRCLLHDDCGGCLTGHS